MKATNVDHNSCSCTLNNIAILFDPKLQMPNSKLLSADAVVHMSLGYPKEPWGS